MDAVQVPEQAAGVAEAFSAVVDADGFCLVVEVVSEAPLLLEVPPRRAGDSEDEAEDVGLRSWQ